MMVLFFFFKQKTSYEMRISDWSSDVCSSDLQYVRVCPIISPRRVAGTLDRRTWPADQLLAPVGYRPLRPALPLLHGGRHDFPAQIGGAQHRGNGRTCRAIRRARDRKSVV